MALDYKKAKCRGVDQKLFFEVFEEATPPKRLEIIANYCMICDQQKECRKLAENSPKTWGLFGGEYFKNGKKINIMKMRSTLPVPPAPQAENFPAEVGTAHPA